MLKTTFNAKKTIFSWDTIYTFQLLQVQAEHSTYRNFKE